VSINLKNSNAVNKQLALVTLYLRHDKDIFGLFQKLHGANLNLDKVHMKESFRALGAMRHGENQKKPSDRNKHKFW